MKLKIIFMCTTKEGPSFIMNVGEAQDMNMIFSFILCNTCTVCQSFLIHFNNTPSPVGAVLWSCVSGLWSSLGFSSVFVSFRFIFFGTLWCETDGVSSSSYDGGLEEAPGVREDWSAEQVFSGFCSWSCEHTKSFKFSCLKAVFAVKWWDF